MQRLSHNQIGICQGSRVLFSDFVDDGPMWAGEGRREHRTPISFDEPFSAPPTARIRASWMAVGALPHEDDWDLY